MCVSSPVAAASPVSTIPPVSISIAAANQRAGRRRQPAGEHGTDAPAGAGPEDDKHGKHRAVPRRPGEDGDTGQAEDQRDPAPQRDPLPVDDPVG